MNRRKLLASTAAAFVLGLQESFGVAKRYPWMPSKGDLERTVAALDPAFREDGHNLIVMGIDHPDGTFEIKSIEISGIGEATRKAWEDRYRDEYKKLAGLPVDLPPEFDPELMDFYNR